MLQKYLPTRLAPLLPCSLRTRRIVLGLRARRNERIWSSCEELAADSSLLLMRLIKMRGGARRLGKQCIMSGSHYRTQRVILTPVITGLPCGVLCRRRGCQSTPLTDIKDGPQAGKGAAGPPGNSFHFISKTRLGEVRG